MEKCERGFTYIDDVVQGVIKALEKPATPDNDFKADNTSLSHKRCAF